MVNRINQVVTLKNGSSFLIVRQAFYNNSSYYICDLIKDDNLTHDFKLFCEVNMDGKFMLKEENDLGTVKTVFGGLKLG